jgi:hypothetical protein
MLLGIALAGAAFAWKLAEFLHAMESPDAGGFVAVPVTVYFIVATGYACLLASSWLKGDFDRIEEPKYEMLERELEYERLEQQGIEP